MRLSPDPEQSPLDASSYALLRDSFYQFSNAEQNTLAALENYVLRSLTQQRSCVVIGCKEPFLAAHLAKFFPAIIAVEENAGYLAELTARQSGIVTCQIEPDDFKLIGRTDLIVVAHLLYALGAWLETPLERNHQRMAFLNHYYGSLEADCMLVILQNRSQNNYKHLLKYLNITPSEESVQLSEQIHKQFQAEHYLFPIEIYTQRAEDMVQALSYLISNDDNWSDKIIPLQTYVQTLLQLDGNYYFNYEAEVIVIRKKAEQ